MRAVIRINNIFNYGIVGYVLLLFGDFIPYRIVRSVLRPKVSVADLTATT